jgi:monoamine oxidase
VTSFISGAMPEQLSLIDLARYADTMVNWRVVEGYGALIARFSRGLPVSLGAEVTAVNWGGPLVTVTTRAGSLRCRPAVITVPVSLLAAEAIRITQRLPQARLTAAAGLPMGQVAKLFLAVEGDPFGIGADRQVTGCLQRAETAIYHLHPLGRPLVEAYWGGPTALGLERAGIAAMTDSALAELTGLFGAGVKGRLRPLLASGWAADPFARGAYSYASPGGADGRAALGGPLDDRLYFAGEARSIDAYSTAHGAYATGVAAAAAILRARR